MAAELVANWKFTAAKEQIMALASEHKAVPAGVQTNGHINGDAAGENIEGSSRPRPQPRRRSSLLMPKRKRLVLLACLFTCFTY